MVDFSGCPWPVDTACASDEWEGYDQAVKDRSIALASATLHRLTGNRVGGCPVTVRPCNGHYARSCGFGNFFYAPRTTFFPHNWNGRWTNSCPCVGTCSCTVLCQVPLPGPVGRLDEVKVNGSTIELSDLRIDNGRYLVYQGSGDCPFPARQDLSKPDTAQGTFSVTYLNAYPVDSIGAYAAGVLAIEFARACSGNTCRLPNSVTMLARQGVTMEITPGSFPEGMTGIHEVDTFIGLWNPKGLARGSTVYSPDIHTPRVTGAL